MATELRIGPRERLVLTAIIEMYIASGEPVASQSIARLYTDKEGMSSATIRNVMVVLSDAGLLEQPHTSAGRVPTARAFRFYVEHLQVAARAAQGHASGGAQLTKERRDEIDDWFSGVSSRQQFLERTSHVLALISSGVGVAAAAAGEMDRLEHIHFSRLTAGRVLAVVVTKGGTVLDRVLQLDHDLAMPELEAAGNFLNQNYHGWSIDRIRQEIERRMEEERSEYDRLMQSINQLCSKGALDGAQAMQVIFVEGVANLLNRGVDQERLRQLLMALEAKQRLMELLSAYVDARQQAVRVVVGLEEAIPDMQNMVLIGTGTRLGEESVGTVAVLAPTRIQYGETIEAVSYIAQLSERILQTQRP
ncbi:MAG: heat-inducible transcriptional repressor HrcA [Acidobacteriaceae bacterium]